MSNWVDITLDVLSSSTVEINSIEIALQNPCDELIKWRAQRSGEAPVKIAGKVREIVSFKAVCNLGCMDQSVNKARRFENASKDRFWGLVWSHIQFVSQNFPNSVFLAEYWDDCMSYGGKIVIHAGDEIRSSYDGEHHAQGMEWVLPNIFAPFKTEYELGLECGSLWSEWMEGMHRQLAILMEAHPCPCDLAPQTSQRCWRGKEEE